MAVLWGFIWVVACMVTVWLTFKRYLPMLIADSKEGQEERLPAPQVTKKFQITFCVVSALVAMFCGFASGERKDALLSLFKMLLTLCVLCVTSITDIKLYKIPNRCVAVLLVGRCLSIIPELIINDGTLFVGVLNSVIAGTASVLFLLLMSKITRGGIGYGDVKLFGALGFLCGVRAVLYTLMLSFFLCAIFSVILLVTKKKQLKDGLPMGPFIGIGFAITVIFGLC